MSSYQCTYGSHEVSHNVEKLHVRVHSQEDLRFTLDYPSFEDEQNVIRDVSYSRFSLQHKPSALLNDSDDLQYYVSSQIESEDIVMSFSNQNHHQPGYGRGFKFRQVDFDPNPGGAIGGFSGDSSSIQNGNIISPFNTNITNLHSGPSSENYKFSLTASSFPKKSRSCLKCKGVSPDSIKYQRTHSPYSESGKIKLKNRFSALSELDTEFDEEINSKKNEKAKQYLDQRVSYANRCLLPQSPVELEESMINPTQEKSLERCHPTYLKTVCEKIKWKYIKKVAKNVFPTNDTTCHTGELQSPSFKTTSDFEFIHNSPSVYSQSLEKRYISVSPNITLKTDEITYMQHSSPLMRDQNYADASSKVNNLYRQSIENHLISVSPNITLNAGEIIPQQQSYPLLPDQNYADDFSKLEYDPSQNIKFVDTHCHLDFLFARLKFNGSFKEYRDSCLTSDPFPASFESCISNFCKPITFKKFHWWSKILEDECVWGAFGCHPHFVDNFGKEEEEALYQALCHPKVIALGEIGLDYSGKNNNSEELQVKIFSRQLEIAIDCKKPLIIHCRDANNQCLTIMKKIMPKDYFIHRHCFTGDWKEAYEWLRAFPNLFMGFTCLVTNNKCKNVRRVAQIMPLERILLETDAPYFVPHNVHTTTKHSHPGMAFHVAAEIAKLRGLNVTTVLKQARQNTRDMYGI